MKKSIIIIISFIIIVALVVIYILLNKSDIKTINIDDNKINNVLSEVDKNKINEVEKENEDINMKIEINEKEYTVSLDNNITTNDIINNLPLTLTLSRYAGHEYYSELPYTPEFDEERTSNIKAGHIYYWDGWNAFVINFEDYDISPYKVVHIGEIVDDDISNILKESSDSITVKVN